MSRVDGPISARTFTERFGELLRSEVPDVAFEVEFHENRTPPRMEVRWRTPGEVPARFYTELSDRLLARPEPGAEALLEQLRRWVVRRGAVREG